MSPALRTALALSLGAAVSLGIARFSYALMLPSMRADLGWSWFTAGAMNTVNAAGYFVGSLLAARWLRRHTARRVLLVSSAVAGVLLVAHGLVASDASLFVMRFATGVATAATLIAGALLAARLADASTPDSPRRLPAGLALGLYFGGTGIGIVASAILVPVAIAIPASHGWQAGWLAMGAAALVATTIMAVATGRLDAEPQASSTAMPFEARRVVFALIAYFLFGLGYIGYMTFVVSLLHEQRLPDASITAFYLLLGLAVCASSWLWAGLLQRCRGGEAMTLLDAILVVATLLPVLSAHPVAVFASGLLFGSVFLALVASTTAFVRHNLAPAQWSRGIALFTTVFAAGQIVGPALIGAVSDATGGLRGGFVFSAAVLALASVVAWRQKPLPA